VEIEGWELFVARVSLSPAASFYSSRPVPSRGMDSGEPARPRLL
jgi:hypothetical protein